VELWLLGGLTFNTHNSVLGGRMVEHLLNGWTGRTSSHFC